jgi:hypothetical protein
MGGASSCVPPSRSRYQLPLTQPLVPPEVEPAPLVTAVKVAAVEGVG